MKFFDSHRLNKNQARHSHLYFTNIFSGPASNLESDYISLCIKQGEEKQRIFWPTSPLHKYYFANEKLFFSCVETGSV